MALKEPNDDDWEKLFEGLETHCDRVVNGTRTLDVSQEQNKTKMNIDVRKGSGMAIPWSH